jgi:hypothetical protein
MNHQHPFKWRHFDSDSILLRVRCTCAIRSATATWRK